jgi:thiamine biosynthesis lipoprotein
VTVQPSPALAASAPSSPPVATPVGLSRIDFRAMGTHVDVLVPVGREASVARAVAIFTAWTRRCSRFDATSELSRLNAAAGRPVIVSVGLFDAIAAAMDAARATDGVFDPTVLRRLEELGYDRTFAQVPAGIPAAIRPPGPWEGSWRSVRLDRATRTVELPAGTGLDLGGIAKGMAVDAAVEALREAGVTPAAVNAGGDIAVAGIPAGQPEWRIAVETRGGGHVVALEHGALATSSTERRRWTRGDSEVNHLIDPRTGAPAATGVASVTVAALRCTQAEVAAKTALLLGPVEGAAFIRRTGLCALFVGTDGSLDRVGRWAGSVPSARADATVRHVRENTGGPVVS